MDLQSWSHHFLSLVITHVRSGFGVWSSNSILLVNTDTPLGEEGGFVQTLTKWTPAWWSLRVAYSRKDASKECSSSLASTSVTLRAGYAMLKHSRAIQGLMQFYSARGISIRMPEFDVMTQTRERATSRRKLTNIHNASFCFVRLLRACNIQATCAAGGRGRTLELKKVW
jgi:hypothetical protein